MMPPQHLHMLPLDNLTEALVKRGFEIVEVDRTGPYFSIDLGSAVLMAVHGIIPDPGKPWRSTRLARVRMAARTAVFLAGVPLVLAAAVVDKATEPLVRASGRSNNYRLLARRI